MPSADQSREVGAVGEGHRGRLRALVAQFDHHRAVDDPDAILAGFAEELVAPLDDVGPHPHFDRERRIRGAVAEAQGRGVAGEQVVVHAVEYQVMRAVADDETVLNRDGERGGADVAGCVTRFGRERVRAVGQDGRVPLQRGPARSNPAGRARRHRA